jgi:hypothetical protein
MRRPREELARDKHLASACAGEASELTTTTTATTTTTTVL